MILLDCINYGIFNIEKMSITFFILQLFYTFTVSYLKMVGMGGIEPPTYAGYLIYSQATTIRLHSHSMFTSDLHSPP